MRAPSTLLTLLLLFPGLVTCSVFNTSGKEETLGRGALARDPYDPIAEVRLSLQMINGCAVLATGEPLGKGTANIPYPDDCKARMLPGQMGGHTPPLRPMPLLANTTYFLNYLSLAEIALDKHKDAKRMGDVVSWFKTLPRFGKLDWRNLGQVSDDWGNTVRSPSPYAWQRKIHFANAAWQNVPDDSFLLEVLDSLNRVVVSATYRRKDFLVENPATFHTELFWRADSVAQPSSPDDSNFVQAPNAPPGFPPTKAMRFQTMFKLELVTQISTENSFQIPEDVRGDGALRLTWSQLPDDPIYFPVRYQAEADPTCFSPDFSRPVACSFGNVPTATFSTPKNGQYYVPGETVQATLGVKDSKGNWIHAQDGFGSFNEMIDDQTNGLIGIHFPAYYDEYNNDMGTSYSFAGPIQDFKIRHELNEPNAYYIAPSIQFIPGIGNEQLNMVYTVPVSENAIPGGREKRIPRVYNFDLPKDAKPGTYLFYWKVHRSFMGERFTKLVPFEIPVGQSEPTAFPGRIGNCQMCHRGTISLENVRHGLAVDYVEGCKICHSRDVMIAGKGIQFEFLIHSAHNSSPKYPRLRSECTACHLTREGATRPSYGVCASCHPQPHGGAYAKLGITSDFEPNNADSLHGNCANACHTGVNTPAGHLLPPQ
ncbi:MAG: multiheme c-type cytochrome [Myxococcaceae bacterium]